MNSRAAGSSRSRLRRSGCWLALLHAALISPANACTALPPVASVIAMDRQDRELSAYDDERTLREFALYSYRNISTDIVNGRGPYLEALVDSFRGACGGDAARLAWLRSQLRAADTVNDFARRLAIAQRTFAHPRGPVAGSRSTP